MSRTRARAAAITMALVASTLSLLGWAAPVQAVTVDAVAVPGGGNTQGIAVTADGSVWAGVQAGAASTVARIAPSGQVTSSPALGGPPVALAVVGGKVWASVPTQQKVVVIDPAAPSVPTSISFAGAHCGPVGIVDGGDGNAYVSLPASGSCATSEIAKVPLAGGAPAYYSGRGTAYALAVAGGSLFVPDFDGDQVRRFSLGTLAPTATYAAPSGSNPAGIAAVGTSVVTSYFGTGGVGSVPATAADQPLTTIGTGLREPFGVAAAGSDVYVAGTASVLVRRADGSTSTVALPAGTEAHDVASRPDGTVWVTDGFAARVLRLTSRAPRATTAGGPSVTAKGASVGGTVDPGGETTTVRAEFGPTTAYGASAAGPTVTGTGDQPVVVTLGGLKAATTYHYRLVATNARGTSTGADQTVTTRLGAKVKVAARTIGKATVISKVTVTKLAPRQKITLTCRGKACPRGARGQRVQVGKGIHSLVLGQVLAGVRLPARTTVVVTVTRKRVPGLRTTIVTRPGKKPTVTTQTTP